MKDHEKTIAAMRHCAKEVGCDGCPCQNNADGCATIRKEAIEIIDELTAQLEQQSTARDLETIAQSHSEEIRKLHDELCRVNVEYERTQRELYEARKELATLRAIKATTEAFLGVKIDGQM